MITILIIGVFFGFIALEVVTDVFNYKSWTIPNKSKQYGYIHHITQVLLFAYMGIFAIIYGRYYSYLLYDTLIKQTMFIIINYVAFRIFWFNKFYNLLSKTIIKSNTDLWDSFLTWFYSKVSKILPLNVIDIFQVIIGFSLICLTTYLMVKNLY